MYETVYRQVMYSLIATFAVPFFTPKTMGRVFLSEEARFFRNYCYSGLCLGLFLNEGALSSWQHERYLRQWDDTYLSFAIKDGGKTKHQSSKGNYLMSSNSTN